MLSRRTAPRCPMCLAAGSFAGCAGGGCRSFGETVATSDEVGAVSPKLRPPREAWAPGSPERADRADLFAAAEERHLSQSGQVDRDAEPGQSADHDRAASARG